MVNTLPAAGNLAARIPLIQIGILAIAAVLQFLWGPLSDDRFGPLPAVIFLMAVLVAVLSTTITIWPLKMERSWPLSLAVPALFATMAMAQLASSFGFEFDLEPIDDIVDLVPSLAASVTLLMVLRLYGTTAGFWIAAIAFAFQGTASLLDLFDDWLVTNLPVQAELIDWFTLVTAGLALAGYACALLMEVSRHFSPKGATAAGAISFVRLFNAAEDTRLGTWLSAKINDVEYLIWRLRNGGGDYSGFYAAQIAAKLARGKSHKTLGNKQHGSGCTASTDISHNEGSFALRGTELFNLCVKLGLSEHDVVIDYGCGSLRIGQHFIKFLEPEHYWGLDVADSFYKIGLSMLPEELVKQKQPYCEVIDEKSLAAAHMAGPSFIICNAVLKHVPKREFGAFMDRLLGLARPGTRIILTFHSAASLVRIKGKSWAYPADQVRSAITSRLGNARIECLLDARESNRLALPIRRENWLIEA